MDYLEKVTNQMDAKKNRRLIDICIKKHFLPPGETVDKNFIDVDKKVLNAFKKSFTIK